MGGQLAWAADAKHLAHTHARRLTHLLVVYTPAVDLVACVAEAHAGALLLAAVVVQQVPLSLLLALIHLVEPRVAHLVRVRVRARVRARARARARAGVWVRARGRVIAAVSAGLARRPAAAASSLCFRRRSRNSSSHACQPLPRSRLPRRRTALIKARRRRVSSRPSLGFCC